jgi:hypothetical protein
MVTVNNALEGMWKETLLPNLKNITRIQSAHPAVILQQFSKYKTGVSLLSPTLTATRFG